MSEVEKLRAEAQWMSAVNLQMKDELMELSGKNRELRQTVVRLIDQYRAVLDRLQAEEQKERES